MNESTNKKINEDGSKKDKEHQISTERTIDFPKTDETEKEGKSSASDESDATKYEGKIDEICKPSVAYRGNSSTSYFVVRYECTVTKQDVQNIVNQTTSGQPSAMYLWFPIGNCNNRDAEVKWALTQFEGSHDEKNVENYIRTIFVNLSLENDPNKINVCEIKF